MRLSNTALTLPNIHSSYTHSPSSVCDRGLLSFRPLTSADIARVRPFVAANIYRTCDYTLGGIFMWVDYFGYEFCILDDTLFIKGISEKYPDRQAFSLPLGRMPLSESVALILDYCAAGGLTPEFSAIPLECAGRLAELCNGSVEPLDSWGDYLYSSAQLASLSGKALSKKRNHVNRFFIDNPQASLEMITAANKAEALDFLRAVDLSAKADIQVATYELQQSVDVVSHIEDYLFDGAVLRDASGGICALTVGEVVGDTLYVHIEKANHYVAGAGETVNKLFASEMLRRYPGLAYINREEDMGDLGLRFAKESYRPLAILRKCDIIAS